MTSLNINESAKAQKANEKIHKKNYANSLSSRTDDALNLQNQSKNSNIL